MSHNDTADQTRDKNAKLAIGDDTIHRVWTKTVNYIAYKTYRLDLPKTAEDIAAEAIEFALNDKRTTWDDTPSSEKHLFYVAKKVAKWHICTEIKKAKRAIISYELNVLEVGKDGEPLENHKAEAKYLTALFHEEQCHKKMMAKGHMAMSRLDGFLAREGVSSRDIEIYKDRDLYDNPTDLVCAKHSITRENLYKIVSVIKSKLRMHGRSMIQD